MMSPGVRPRAAGRELGQVLRQVIDGEIEQAGIGPLGVVRDLHPAGVGHLPLHEQPRHRQVVGGAAEESFVPDPDGVKIGHGDNGRHV